MRGIMTANSYLSFLLLYFLANVDPRRDPAATRSCNTLHEKGSKMTLLKVKAVA